MGRILLHHDHSNTCIQVRNVNLERLKNEHVFLDIYKVFHLKVIDTMRIIHKSLPIPHHHVETLLQYLFQYQQPCLGDLQFSNHSNSNKEQYHRSPLNGVLAAHFKSISIELRFTSKTKHGYIEYLKDSQISSKT